VDISKPSDTVPHSATKPSLERKGVLIPIIDLIVEMYKGCKTTIHARNNKGVEIETLRGVKQGHHLSQLLFNLCVEALLDEIEEKTGDINVNSRC
jgi:hypothetical protein